MKVKLCFAPDGPPEPVSPPMPPRPSSQARQLALAYHIDALIASGEYKDIAHVARVAGVSRARVSQVLDLTLLAPWIKAGIVGDICGFEVHSFRFYSTMFDWKQ